MRTRFLKVTLAIAGLFFISLGLFLFWAVGKNLPKEASLDIQVKNKAALHAKDQITILTYNIGHGQGVKIEPTDWRDEDYTRQKMTELTRVIHNVNPDIISMQEVDIDSNRTHHIDEATWIADKAHYPYRACALVWDENYIPYPYWPIKHHLGKTKSANCILSRYPLSNHRRILFKKPKNNAFWYNWAYLERGAQLVEVTVGEKHFTLLNLHLEAFDADSRQEQAHELVSLLNTLEGPVVFGGDFNSDDSAPDYRQDQTLKIIRKGIPAFTEAPLAGFSFPANKADQRLDALFAFGGATLLNGHVVNEAGLASDHLPVLGLVTFQK
ncbi:MAG: endonuclease/exonuclease/phosphatase family protein [Myxococcaceae bacterium]